ncbi:hypothetical protein CFC21_085692 [Triticum aestivum]|uniref:AAA+ ATPase domain-containing protein n=3 Tax=Triticum aestivum TaxID=4565 RepID=A0A3B6PCQ3_WHEAT|nr:disease resistance protein RGA5-like isoform X1 [Triticum aestivum]KAF7081787.1 hypothetical protein CFC21_085692 [Triticum aestivum]
MEVVTGAMGSLLPKLGELLVSEYKLQKGVKEDVESLEREMKSMNAALVKVAEVPRDQLDNQVIIWADELRELSYDMEDVVDNFLVYVKGSESDAVTDSNKLKGLMVKMTNLFTKGKTRHQIADAMRDIKNRAQEVADRHNRYRVDDAVANAAGKHKVDPRLLALYKTQKELVGIEDARNELTNMLTDGVGDGDVPKKQHMMKMVSILGPGGLGKTTLAKAVYDTLQTQFECTAFVPVGRNPEVKKVLRDILLEVGKKQEHIGDVAILDERQLINILQRLLENARYLIVIDDIWDLEAWNIIKCALLDNNHGSRVITTTRILDVATNTGDIYKLKPLSHHLSEELFYTRLFGGKDKCPFGQPAEVSDKILQKCGGVPLAIITIASLLAGKPMEDWSKVFNSIGFGSGDSNTDVENTRKILLFSYYDLPYYLRSCLLHMSVYPEDYLIRKDKLIWQWVAEGFVSEEPGVSLFETGERYFNELANRSMIQPVEYRQPYTIDACRIHDMVLDMICLLSKQQNFVTILDSNEKNIPSPCNARRLAVQNRAVPLTNMSMPKVRSWYAIMCDPNALPSLSNFQVLRVLDMEKCGFDKDHPYHLEHFRRLPQLRYLGLKGTYISKLPEEIGELKFLQTLDLRSTYIRELPESIGLLRQLKCLHADVNGVGITVPNWIGNLTSLEELHLNAADKSCIFVKELRKLTELRVLFCRLTADVDECWMKCFVESLCNLRKIQVLGLYFSLTQPTSELDDYWKGYEPPRQLRDLCIQHGFSRVPAWFNCSLLPNLSSLDMEVGDFGEQDVLNFGGLPELTCLWNAIPGGMEFPDGAFPKLRICRVHAPFRFLQGSMQSLESIYIIVHVRALKDASTDLDFIGSLGDLPSVRRVDAQIGCNGASASDIEKVKAAVRQAIDTHPNRPTLHLDAYGLPQTDEEKSDLEQTKQELLVAPCLDHTTSVGTSAQLINDNNDEEEESDSVKTEQKSDHEDENRPGPHLTESSVDIASTSPPVPAQRQTWRRWAWFACLNSGSSNSAAPSTAGSKQCGGSGQGMGRQEAEDDSEAAQP